MNEKNNRFNIVAVLLAFILGGAIGGILVYGYLQPSRSVDREPERAIGINREITDSLSRGLDRDREAISAVERIRERKRETDRVIAELGRLDNGSGDILQILRKRIEILESYYRDTGGIICGSGNGGD